MNLPQILSISAVSRGILNRIFTQKLNSFVRPTSLITNVIQPCTFIQNQLQSRAHHCLCPSNKLLQAQVPQVTPVCGFKVKGRLKKRCKDCYFVVRDERTYIICPTHPRHKQMSFIKKEKNNRIMTPFAIQGKQRPW